MQSVVVKIQAVEAELERVKQDITQAEQDPAQKQILQQKELHLLAYLSKLQDEKILLLQQQSGVRIDIVCCVIGQLRAYVSSCGLMLITSWVPLCGCLPLPGMGWNPSQVQAQGTAMHSVVQL
jgi:hypothetical protein